LEIVEDRFQTMLLILCGEKSR